jgi:hypothetical protein
MGSGLIERHCGSDLRTLRARAGAMLQQFSGATIDISIPGHRFRLGQPDDFGIDHLLSELSIGIRARFQSGW